MGTRDEWAKRRWDIWDRLGSLYMCAGMYVQEVVCAKLHRRDRRCTNGLLVLRGIIVQELSSNEGIFLAFSPTDMQKTKVVVTFS